jgi:hypothetical protein
MLYLNPPYYLINGVSIFPDHEDPLQFYYLPMMPHLTTVTDSSGAALPQLQLIEYVGSAGSGGFIEFDVNLGIAQDALNEVAQELKRQANLSDSPRLSPVTFVDGSVRLMILGSETPDPTAKPPATQPATTDGQPGGPRFVVKIQGSATPSLYGDNQATFSVQLDQYGASILEQALQGTMAPVAVIYSLEFLALRPAFNVHLNVDWNRVHTYLDDHFSGGFLFFSTDIDKAVDKLIEDRVITIDVDSFIPDGDMSKSTAGDRDRAVAQVYDMIKDTFFQPSMPPQGGDDMGSLVSTARNVSQLLANGGAAMLSKKSVDLTQVDQKTLDVNIQERTAVQRTIYPQGHLAGLFDTLKKTGVSLDQFVLKVDTDQAYFQRRKLKISTKADFDGDSIASIDVNLNYNGQIQSVRLTKDQTEGAVDWTSVLNGAQMVRPVSYTYTVNFNGSVDGAQRPLQLTSNTMQALGDSLDIEPRADLYAITVIPIRADNLPFDRYPNVEVECRYIDEANGLHEQASAVLTAGAPDVNWPLFIRDKTKRAFEYRLTYALATGGTKVTPWISTEDGKVDIADPFPSKINLTVVPAVDWSTDSQVLVYVAYPSKDNAAVQKNYILNADSGAQTFVAERQNNADDSVYYEVRILGQHGKIWSVPGSVTSDNYLVIQDGMHGHQRVRVAPQQVDFAAKRISEIDVQMRYADPKNSLSASASLKLALPSDVQVFEFDYLDPSVRPEYRADIVLNNGLTKSLDWTPASGAQVTIDLSQLD